MFKRSVVLGLMLVVVMVTACAQEDWQSRLPYAGPVEIGVKPGQFLPGTDIQYVTNSSQGAQVAIGGKETTRRLGDSLDWKGEMVPGVTVDQTLRILLITDQSLQTGGTVRIVVANPQPQAEAANTTTAVHYKLPVGYHVQKGNAIPGTPITYVGSSTEGAQLGGVEGYAYRKLGDSILWEGKLRDGLWIQLTLRTALIREEQLDVVGTVDVWIQPSG